MRTVIIDAIPQVYTVYARESDDNYGRHIS